MNEIEMNSFDNMNLKESLLRGIYSYGFENPSNIQYQAIPKIIEGIDVIAQSQSGTGKTGAFVIGTLQKIDESMNTCQAIVLAHTRELALQIYDVCSNISTYTNVKIILCIGGSDMRNTINDLKKGVHVVIGTPGRINDLISKRYINTYDVNLLVIDEADEMLSFSFKDQIRKIIEELSLNTQICIFSATLPEPIIELTKKFMNKPEKILISKELLSLEGIKQFYINVERENCKFETLNDLFGLISMGQTIVYVNSIKKANFLEDKLTDKHFSVSIIHGLMMPNIRSAVVKKFKDGDTRILISTDLLSRGIDIQQVSVVINYDIPKNKECYIHRIGRSGRFGRKGLAINFITQHERHALDDIKSFYETEIDPMPTDIQKYL